VQSSEGGDEYEGHPGYRTLAQKAMVWYERGMRCNPYDGYNYLYYGWCLDWLGRHPEAESYFNRAEECDPNGYYTLANIGRHYVEMGNFAAARPWFERSLKLQRKDNKIAVNYLEICNRKLLEAATNSSPLRLQ
jgi:tetratricopeptide (TPR) repeat protein